MHKAIKDVLKLACRERKRAYPKSMTSKQAYVKVLKNPIDLRWFVRRIDEAEGYRYKTIHLGAPINIRIAIRRVRQWAKARGVKL